MCFHNKGSTKGLFFFSFLIFDLIGASIAVILLHVQNLISPIIHFLLGFILFFCRRGLAAIDAEPSS